MTNCPKCGADTSTPCKRRAHEIGGLRCQLTSARNALLKEGRMVVALEKENMELRLEVERLTSKLRNSLED